MCSTMSASSQSGRRLRWRGGQRDEDAENVITTLIARSGAGGGGHR
jgi:hypothetical protein